MVARERDCTLCRNCIRDRDAGWHEKVVLKRVADHFIFAVESTGQMTAEDVLLRSMRVLGDKARGWAAEVGDWMEGGSMDEALGR